MMKLQISLLAAIMASLSAGIELESSVELGTSAVRDFENNACVWQEIDHCGDKWLWRPPCPDDMTDDWEAKPNVSALKAGWWGTCGYMFKLPGQDDSKRWFYSDWDMNDDACLQASFKKAGKCPALTMMC